MPIKASVPELMTSLPLSATGGAVIRVEVVATRPLTPFVAPLTLSVDGMTVPRQLRGRIRHRADIPYVDRANGYEYGPKMGHSDHHHEISTVGPG
jgi:hypothetical protein